MKRVNIYLWSSVKSLKTAETLNAAVGYIVQIQTSKGPAEVGKTVLLNDLYEKTTANHSEMVALKLALSRINIKCELDLWSENRYICSVFSQGWLKNWETTGFLKGNGEEVVDAEKWREVACLLNGRGILTHPQEEHEYKGYLEREVERRAKKYV